MTRKKWVGLSAVVLLAVVVLGAGQPEPMWFNRIRMIASGYINWGATGGSGGYGIRDNAGTIQSKNSGGSWAAISTAPMVYPGAGIALSSAGAAWGTSITTSAGLAGALGDETGSGYLVFDTSPAFRGVFTGNWQGFVDTGRYGFLNQTETTIAFDGTSVFTLGDAGGGWSYYRAGLKYTISGDKTIDLLTVETPLIDDRLYYIYIDATDGTLSGSISAWTLNDTKVPVATVKWNNTLTPKYWLAEERHSVLIDRRTHYYEHFTEGSKVIAAGATSGSTTATDTNAAKTFGIALTTIADEDIIQSLIALADPDGTATDYVVMYRTGASTWTWKASNMPFLYNAGTNAIQWDNGGTATDASSFGPGANTRWINSYVLFTNMQGAARYIIIPGQHEYTTLAAAQAEAPSSFTFTEFPIAEAVIAYRVTWDTRTATSQGKCLLSAQPVAINIAAISAIGSGATLDHNTLAGLQGGTTSEYYHLTSTEYGYVSDATGTGVFVRGTSPRITTSLLDANGLAMVGFTPTASATTYVNVTNYSTGSTGPLIAPAGETNVDLRLAGAGTGKVKVDASYGAINAATDEATITFNLALSNFHTVTLGDNRILALSNASTGQCFIVRLQQDGSGSRTVTWWNTIRWAGGSAPTLTATLNKADVFGFCTTGSNTYDGFIVGQAL